MWKLGFNVQNIIYIQECTLIPKNSSFNYSITPIAFFQRPGLPGGLEFELSLELSNE